MTLADTATLSAKFQISIPKAVRVLRVSGRPDLMRLVDTSA
jgi:hypothetical protein